MLCDPESEPDVWRGPASPNHPISPVTYARARATAIRYLSSRDHVYQVDGYAGWDKEHQVHVRVLCARPYHALFMRNMLCRPMREEVSRL